MQRPFTFSGRPPGVGLLLSRSTLGAGGVVKAGVLLNHDGRMAIDAAALACAAASRPAVAEPMSVALTCV